MGSKPFKVVSLGINQFFLLFVDFFFFVKEFSFQFWGFLMFENELGGAEKVEIIQFQKSLPHCAAQTCLGCFIISVAMETKILPCH